MTVYIGILLTDDSSSGGEGRSWQLLTKCLHLVRTFDGGRPLMDEAAEGVERLVMRLRPLMDQ